MLMKASYGRQMSVNSAWKIFLWVVPMALVKCCSKLISFGLRMTLIVESNIEGKITNAVTQNVQNNASDSIVQLAIKRSSKAMGTRLLLRLSKIFQRESA